MLLGTIGNYNFQRNTALRYCCDIVWNYHNIVPRLLPYKSSFHTVSANINCKTRDLVRPLFFCSLSDQNSNLAGHTSLDRRSLKKERTFLNLLLSKGPCESCCPSRGFFRSSSLGSNLSQFSVVSVTLLECGSGCF